MEYRKPWRLSAELFANEWIASKHASVNHGLARVIGVGIGLVMLGRGVCGRRMEFTGDWIDGCFGFL